MHRRSRTCSQYKPPALSSVLVTNLKSRKSKPGATPSPRIPNSAPASSRTLLHEPPLTTSCQGRANSTTPATS